MGINRKAATLIASAVGVLAIGGGVTAAALSAGGGSHPAGGTQPSVQNVDYATEPNSTAPASSADPAVAVVSASRSTASAPVVSPSTKKRAVQQKTAVQDQGDPVTDATSSSADVPVKPTSAASPVSEAPSNPVAPAPNPCRPGRDGKPNPGQDCPPA